jgi:hypothetical protein
MLKKNITNRNIDTNDLFDDCRVMMQNLVKFYDVTEWQEKPHFQTGGTRNKIIVEDTSNRNLYFFKTSLERKNDAYKYEFWSEIVASAIGTELGFNTLHYDIAMHGKKIGCLSQSMIDTDKNVLLDITKYLCNYDVFYNPESKRSYHKYTFYFIVQALKAHGLENKIYHIIETIIFDSLIGNGDRHQENWGCIVPNTSIENKPNMKRLFRSLLLLLGCFNVIRIDDGILTNQDSVFSPIYDSGSCLGRELLDEKVEKMLNDEQLIQAYISHDRYEVRWDETTKMNHFNLIRNIMNNTQYGKIVINEIQRIISVWNIENIQKIIYEIDEQLPIHLNLYKLPDNRKQLMLKLIIARFDKLREILK